MDKDGIIEGLSHILGDIGIVEYDDLEYYFEDISIDQENKNQINFEMDGNKFKLVIELTDDKEIEILG